MRVLKFAIFLLIFSLIACKKENNYPIIKPGSYFPVYPGSWWKYIHKDSTITIDTTSPTYQLHHYSNYWDGENAHYSDPVYVPFLNGQPIYKYDKIEYEGFPGPLCYGRWPILSEEIGYKFDRNWIDKRVIDDVEHVLVKEKIFNDIDSVLILEGHWIYPVYPNFIRYQEFVKGVGLAMDITYDSLSNDTISKKILIDFFIADDVDL